MTALPPSAEDSHVPATGASARLGRARNLWDTARASGAAKRGPGTGGRWSWRGSSTSSRSTCTPARSRPTAATCTTPRRDTLEGLIGGARAGGRRDRRVLGVAHRGPRTAPRTRRSTAACWAARTPRRRTASPGWTATTRVLRDRARPRRKADGGVLVDGIISDITAREEAAARLAEASDRFTSLLDVVGAHVYLALALPDGSLEELFQGPGGDRLLGGAEPDPEMVNWDAAVHPDDRPAYDEFNRALGRGEDAEVMYRLIGADGVTRWVHDRARVPPAPGRHVRGERDRLGRDRAAPARGRPAAEHAGDEAPTASSSAPVQRPSCAPAPTSSRAPSTAATSPRSPRSRSTADPGRCGLLLLDADHFKQINDAYGHAVGDAVLVDLAQRLRSELDPGDCLARWGGEEFAVLLRGVGSDRGARPARRALPPRRRRHADRPRRRSGSSSRSRSAALSRPATARPSTRSLDKADSLPVRGQAPGPKPRLAPPRRNARRRRSIARSRGRSSMARALAFACSLREGIPKSTPSRSPGSPTLTAEHLGAARRRRPALPARPDGCTTSGSWRCPNRS